MNKEECELCIKYKTMYCPNSSECYMTQDKPYYQNKIMLLEENKELKEKVNQLETNRDEAIEYIQKHFEEEYKKPREELKKYNLKNCTYDSGLVVLGILERGKEDV